ncbi:MAG: phosphate ABC transporter permease subunit PstC [Ruminococcaceae bacterium]|nr:phosphate ABC transporter permease subunit PstC [Oscillospiraceae bacterium]
MIKGKKIKGKKKERLMQGVFLIAACASVLAIALICVFLFAGGVPAMAQIGLFDFLFGTEWRPANDVYGILPMIVGSLCVTAGALVVGVPIGLLTAIYLACFCPGRLHRFLRPMVELLAGIPSVVYGFFGLVVLVPMVRTLTNNQSNGLSILTASILLGIMILPTVVTVSESALRAVPSAYHEGALALGATGEQSAFFVRLPAARSGVLAAVALGIGRAIGEAMAVIMVLGNQPRMLTGLLQGARTLTANIVLEMGYAADLHREALIATGVVLFVFILLVNLATRLLRKKEAA